MKASNWILGLVGVLFLASCQKEEDAVVDDTTVQYSSGTYIVNEGAFLSANASVTHIANDGKVTHNVYQQLSGLPLGDVATSAVVHGSNLAVVINNSQEVALIGRGEMSKSSSVSLDYPRQAASLENGDVAVTNGSLAGELVIIDGATFAVTENVAVGVGPEGVAEADGHIFVCNNGGWGLDSTVTVINASDYSTVAAVEVGYRPFDIAVDAQDRVWVLCSGETLYDMDWNVVGHTSAKLVVMNASGVLDSRDIGLEGDHPKYLEVSADGSEIYFVNGDIWKVTADNTIADPQIAINGNFAGFTIDPISGNIWVAQTPDYVNNDEVYEYDTSGVLLNTIEAGVAPVKVLFAE